MNKICKKCKRELPLTEEYFFKNKQLKDGFENSCKECRGSKFGVKPKKPIAKEGFKICPHCEKELPATLEYFHFCKGRKDNLNYLCKQCANKRGREKYVPEKHSKYYQEHKEDILNKRKEYYKENREKKLAYDSKRYSDKKVEILKYHKEYREKNKDVITAKRKEKYNSNKEAILSRNKKYYEQNKEKILVKNKEYREKNKEAILKVVKEYRNTPKGKLIKKLSEEKRRTLKKECLSTLTKDEWVGIKENFNNKCAYCGSETEKITIDHFIPLSKKGELSKRNVLPCCSKCNSSKNDSDFVEWYRKQKFYSKENEEYILKYIKEQGEKHDRII